MRARAGAMEELEAAGAFDDNLQLGSRRQDDIDRQLARADLRRARSTTTSRSMKAELGQGSAPAPGELERRLGAAPSEEKPA